MMKKTLLYLALTVLPLMAAAQETPPTSDLPPTISVSAKGSDVREVLHTMFTQVRRSFVMEPNVRFALFLSLEEVEFDEALQIVCQTAELKIDIQNGIYYISKAPAKRPVQDVKPEVKPVQPNPSTATAAGPASAAGKAAAPTTAAVPTAAVPPVQATKPKGRLTETVLTKRLTTRLDKTDIRMVFGAFARQTGVEIEVDASVPNYKLDAYLLNTSLKFALDKVTEAAGLKYRFTDEMSIQIYRPEGEHRVQIITD
jgi:type II secretory pathway component GspD/PulD (secretin)